MSTIYLILRFIIYSQVLTQFKIDNLIIWQDYAFNLTLAFTILGWLCVTENYYAKKDNKETKAIQESL